MNTRLEVRVSMMCRATLWMAFAALVAACGSGSSGEPQETRQPTNSPTPTPPSDDTSCTNAIEGGGRRLAGVVSEVAGEHVTVSKVRFDAAAAKVYVDDELSSVSTLRPGDVVSVTGTIGLDAGTGCASEIFSDAVIVAAIETVDSVEQSLIILGHVVEIESTTVFGDSVQPQQLAALQPGDTIRLAGLYKAAGVIEASRIDRASGGYAVSGVVTEVNTEDDTFRLNGSILVHYSAAGLIDFATGEPRVGDPVRVTGTDLDAAPSAPDVAALHPTYVWYGRHGTGFTVFPSGFRMNRGEWASFVASSGPGSVTWRIVHADGRACTPDACGVIDSVGGVYQAAKFGNDERFLVIATSIADPSASVTVPLYVSNDPQMPATGSNTLEGNVFSAEAGPLAGGYAALWVDPEGMLPMVWFDQWVDESGHFVARHLPDAAVYVTAIGSDQQQPCVVKADVRGDLTVPVEMMSASAFDRFDAPRPQSIVEPTWTGTIYEMTPNGRQPVAGASVVVHLFMWDNVVAYTLSDRGGNFFLCNLGPDMWINVSKPGFAEKPVFPLDPSRSQVMDIELTRE